MNGAIHAFQGKLPQLGPGVFIAAGAHVIGDVILGEEASVWFNAVLRGDVEPIRVGARTNLQDLSMLHTSSGFPTTVGDGVTVGHRAILHGCTIEDECLIGMGAIILDGAYVERGCLIAAGALVPPGARVPANAVFMGSPGQVKRQVTPRDRQLFQAGALHYVELGQVYLDGPG